MAFNFVEMPYMDGGSKNGITLKTEIFQAEIYSKVCAVLNNRKIKKKILNYI